MTAATSEAFLSGRGIVGSMSRVLGATTLGATDSRDHEMDEIVALCNNVPAGAG